MNLIQINDTFPMELHCVKHLELVRWGKVPKCAYYESDRLGKRQKDNRFTYKSHLKTSGLAVGTRLKGTKIPFKTWFMAFAIVSDAKRGLSAMQLQRHLGMSYRTAWAMYHKMRDLMAMKMQIWNRLKTSWRWTRLL